MISLLSKGLCSSAVQGTRDQIASICWITEKARELQEKKKKKPTSILLMTQKPLTVWITTNCGKFLQMGILDHFTCLLRHLHAGQEATIRTEHGTMDWFKIEKRVCEGCIVSLIFNLYAELLLFSYPVMSDSLQPRELQHVRLPCPSSSPRVCPGSCPLQW